MSTSEHHADTGIHVTSVTRVGPHRSPRAGGSTEPAPGTGLDPKLSVQMLARMTRLLTESRVLVDLIGDSLGLNLSELRRELTLAGETTATAYGAAQLKVGGADLAPPLPGTSGNTPQAVFARHEQAAAAGALAVQPPRPLTNLWSSQLPPSLRTMAAAIPASRCNTTTKTGGQCRNNKVRLPVSGGIAAACEKHLPEAARASYKAERQQYTDELTDHARAYAHRLTRIWSALETNEHRAVQCPESAIGANPPAINVTIEQEI